MEKRFRRAVSLVRVLVILVICGVVAGGAFAVYAALRPTVTVTRLVEGPVIRAVYATGTISPVREYPIRASTAGTLSEVMVDKGDAVTAGQVLATVADSSLVYAADRAQAELREKQARLDPATSPVLAEFDARIRAATEQLAIAQREETRLRQLLEDQARSTTDLDRAADRVQAALGLAESLKSQRASALLELEREVAFAQSAAKTAQWDLDQQQARSPIDGVVLDRPIPQGTRVAINDTLMRVADVTPANLVMRAAVDEEDITSVSVGQKVIMTLYAFPDEKFLGKVKTIYAEADPNRRTFEVDVEIEQPSDRFQPGMTGELAFVVTEKASAQILPSQAVQKGGVVYVIRDGRIVPDTPEIGVRAVDRVEVLSGIAPDARVVISPIAPGDVGKHARVTEIDPRAAAGLDPTGAMKGAEAFKGWR